MPVKSHSTEPPKKRLSAESISEKRELAYSLPLPDQHEYCYKSFIEFCQRIVLLKLPENWSIEVQENNVIVKKQCKDHYIPQFEIFIDQPFLAFTH